MKLFFNRIFIFSLTTSAVLFFLVGLVYILTYNYQFDTINKKNIFLGDSNSMNAINDSLVTNSKNLSGSADSYFYSYLKLRKIINSENKIQRVFLSFSPHNIIDNSWLFNETDLVSRFPIYMSMLDKSDFNFLFDKKENLFKSSIYSTIKNSISIYYSILTDKIDKSYGGYEPTYSNNLKKAIISLNENESVPNFRIPQKFIIYEEEILYLNKIINLCKTNNIELNLIITPKRKELLSFKKYFYKEFLLYYEANFSNINLYNFSDFTMPDDSYDDLVHLNYKGSVLFSKHLNDIIN